MIHHSHCPVCHSDQISFLFAVKDYTVSKADFPVWHCGQCTARFTQDIPDQVSIGAYYASQDYISHSDTREGLINKLYHWVRKNTLRSKRKLVVTETQVQKGEILDIGCGTGAFLNEMKNAGWNITGLEPDAIARQKAGELYSITPQPSSDLFELKSGSYQAITMWHVLEHVHDLHPYLQQLEKLLAPGGCIFIAVPNYTSADASHYQQYWAAYDVPRHLYHFSPASMKPLMEKYGLQITAYKPMWYDSFYVSMLSEPFKKGRSNLLAACWNGFVSNLQTMADKKKCSSVIYVIKKQGSK